MRLERAQEWLSQKACPLWLRKGIDWERGGFYESLSLQGEPVSSSRRVMVQARQIFSSHIAMDLGFISPKEGYAAIQQGAQFILANYSQSSGAFSHAVDEQLKPITSKPEDLYAQAFALFGLAHAYVVLANPTYKNRAKELLIYLSRERRLPQGGYSEILSREIQYEANPHMHLLEALLYWMEIDGDPEWKHMADEILTLCQDRFIDPQKNILAEHFDSQWKPLQKDGKYVFEPGHHYEWVWLLGRYQKIVGVNLSGIRKKLYHIAETYGIDSEKKSAYDEVDSDFQPHKKTARFWPQCERIKAALQLGLESESVEEKASCAKAADEAFDSLFQFLEVPIQGLWYDTWLESGEFTTQPAKASSFYHIIGALADYIVLRPQL